MARLGERSNIDWRRAAADTLMALLLRAISGTDNAQCCVSRKGGEQPGPFGGISLTGFTSRLESRIPAGSPTSGRWLNRVALESALDQDPGNDRIRVPHLSSAKLVATPDKARHRGNDLQDALGGLSIVCQSARPVNGLGDVGDVATVPDPHLVAEDAKATGPASSNRSLGHDTAITSVEIGNRGLLDHVDPILGVHLESGVGR
jgi:hypothetical protein